MDFGYCLVEPLYWCLGLCRPEATGFPLKSQSQDKEKKKTQVEEKTRPLPFEKSESVGLESGKMGKTCLPGNRTAACQESSREQCYEVWFMLLDSEDNQCQKQ